MLEFIYYYVFHYAYYFSCVLFKVIKFLSYCMLFLFFSVGKLFDVCIIFCCSTSVNCFFCVLCIISYGIYFVCSVRL